MSVSKCYAYYCSGHGYGHATRVSAFATALLSLPEDVRPEVHITSSAPKMVFALAIAAGAHYRESLIDPVIVQPVAYQVDRRKSVDVLDEFLSKKDSLLAKETCWLQSIRADCVLSDAAFLGCLAAHTLGLPSVLITNFSFDSIYSFLSTKIPDSRPTLLQLPQAGYAEADLPDVPIEPSELQPLVEQIWEGYRCADLLVLLPAHIPIPSFWTEPSLPAQEWIDPGTSRPYPEMNKYFGGSLPEQALHPPLPHFSETPKRQRTRKVIHAPLIVRPPTEMPSPYSPSGRTKVLEEMGVPAHFHDPTKTKILVISFGGQVFQRPGRSGQMTPVTREPSPDFLHHHRENRRRMSSQSPSLIIDRPSSPSSTSDSTAASASTPPTPRSEASGSQHRPMDIGGANVVNLLEFKTEPTSPRPTASGDTPVPRNESLSDLYSTLQTSLPQPPDIVAQSPDSAAPDSYFFIPGAPPVSRTRSITRSPNSATHSRFPSLSVPVKPPPIEHIIPTLITSPPTPAVPDFPSTSLHNPFNSLHLDEHPEDDIVDLLPDETWIAIICGVSKSQWLTQQGDGSGGDAMPDRFFIAPRHVYMPDLTAIADVLLGKLGYGTVAEAVDACTPFVYVSRPLFIEEHGLRTYLNQAGTGIELSRDYYESGDWAWAIEDAYERGRDAKTKKRQNMGLNGATDTKGIDTLVRTVVDWVEGQK
ncbi:hypothetical protein DL96DRAFT_1608173 [Flagelloscypha sp. PMI_526]|nr:hypothetical protein DL96DRAFT_1608173 [Flagelloscypha sp. PMI_526]